MSIRDLFTNTGVWKQFKSSTEPVKSPPYKFEYYGIVVYDAYADVPPEAVPPPVPQTDIDLQAAADYGE